MLTNEEKIKRLVKKANTAIAQSELYCRSELRKALIDIEDLGGYISLGFSNARDFCLQHFPDHHWKYISAESSHKDIELLCGIPVGYYSHLELKYLTYRINKGVPARKSKTIKGIRCLLDNAESCREAWRRIQQISGKEFPTREELYLAAKQLHEEDPERFKEPTPPKNLWKNIREERVNFRYKIHEALEELEELRETISSQRKQIFVAEQKNLQLIETIAATEKELAIVSSQLREANYILTKIRKVS